MADVAASPHGEIRRQPQPPSSLVSSFSLSGKLKAPDDGCGWRARRPWRGTEAVLPVEYPASRQPGVTAFENLPAAHREPHIPGESRTPDFALRRLPLE